jgi:opacity protein-like surface antigen
MRKSLCLLTLGTLFGLSVYAQEGPKADLFLGYSFVRYNSAQTIPAFTANGGIATFGWNFSDHLALEAELGGYHNGNVNNYQFDSTAFSYLFGPRISYGRAKKMDPYIHALFGGQNFSTGIANVSTATNNFAMAIGGGLDFRLNRRITIRPVQLDYYLTRIEAPNVTLPAGSSTPSARNQNNLRYAAGIQFTFGGPQ